MIRSFWLFKTEPETYSFQQLLKDKKTHWNGVRNFQARNFLKECAVGDEVLIYHSGDERQIVGVAQIVRESYPDLDPEHAGDWVQVDIQAGNQLKTPVTLKEIKSQALLQDLLLVKQSRLSVMPVSQKHFELLLKMKGGVV